jgi:hypothetical protein
MVSQPKDDDPCHGFQYQPSARLLRRAAAVLRAERDIFVRRRGPIARKCEKMRKDTTFDGTQNRQNAERDLGFHASLPGLGGFVRVQPRILSPPGI